MMQTEPLSMTQSANRRIRSFRQRFGDGHFYLACHAALPLALTPDLLYRLWATFQRDCQDDDLAMPWIAVSDLLLSGLCDEVGDELYEMDSTVRDALMQQLKDSPRLGLVRVRELAEFVIAYIDPQRASADLDTRDFAQAQHWRALAYQQPQKAVQAIATTLAELSFDETHEWMRMAALVEMLEEPLVEFPELLVYVGAIDDFVRGNDRSAIDKLKQIADGNQQIQIADVDLPIPVAIQKEDPKINPTFSEHETSLIDVIRQYSYWLIGGSVLATMTFGGVILYNSQMARSPQPITSAISAITPSPQISQSPTPIPTPKLPLSEPAPEPTASTISAITPSPQISQSPTPTPNPSSSEPTLEPTKPSSSTSNPSLSPSPQPSTVVKTPSDLPSQLNNLPPTTLLPLTLTEISRATFTCREDVRLLQIRLRELDLLNGGEEGSVDSCYGPMTKAAVMRYQQSNSLPATGFVDSNTLNSINTVSRKK